MAKQKFEVKEVEAWLFNGASGAGKFPQSKLEQREPEKYAPKGNTASLKRRC